MNCKTLLNLIQVIDEKTHSGRCHAFIRVVVASGCDILGSGKHSLHKHKMDSDWAERTSTSFVFDLNHTFNVSNFNGGVLEGCKDYFVSSSDLHE